MTIMLILAAAFALAFALAFIGVTYVLIGTRSHLARIASDNRYWRRQAEEWQETAFAWCAALEALERKQANREQIIVPAAVISSLIPDNELFAEAA